MKERKRGGSEEEDEEEVPVPFVSQPRSLAAPWYCCMVCCTFKFAVHAAIVGVFQTQGGCASGFWWSFISRPLGWHYMRDKTLVTRHSVWWPGLLAAVDLKRYIRTYPLCKRVQANHLLQAGLLSPLPLPPRRGGTSSRGGLHQPRLHRGSEGAMTSCRCTLNF